MTQSEEANEKEALGALGENVLFNRTRMSVKNTSGAYYKCALTIRSVF